MAGVPKNHINVRILHHGSKATRRGIQKPSSCVGSISLCGPLGPFMRLSTQKADCLDRRLEIQRVRDSMRSSVSNIRIARNMPEPTFHVAPFQFYSGYSDPKPNWKVEICIHHVLSGFLGPGVRHRLMPLGASKHSSG